MSFPPNRGPYRDHLTHDRLGGVRPARNDGLDVIDLDTTGHPPLHPAVSVVAYFLTRSNRDVAGSSVRPIPTVISSHTRGAVAVALANYAQAGHQ
ncbi:hypothetical protein I553_3273 [Mycobacterium xenopi 4042]|uniref:Uncharacterized protein n=1 Tax=Mycobacterium xenopi 4042 TaxID=1299334 RepID=X8E6D3_MYCXE|nr:hypothetical protein I553_3273 [Mycobacterium xenopi 4042]